MLEETELNKMSTERKFMALVAVEHDLLREKIAGILSREKEIWSTAQVCDMQGARKVCESSMPDIMVYDVGDGLVTPDCVREMKGRGSVEIIAFSDDDGEAYREAARKAGADEFVVAHSLYDALRSTINKLSMRKEKSEAAAV